MDNMAGGDEKRVQTITSSNVEDAYARWAPVYDNVFALIMKPGRQAAADAVNRLEGRVLDVGIGTGLELPLFSTQVKITGIDLCGPMLDIARRRVADLGLRNVEELRVMDAMNLEYSDHSFDAAVTPYVITTVPDPARTLDEMVRVVRPGGEIIIVNHIGAESGPISWIEAAMAKQAAKLGWRPQFPWSIIGDWIAARPEVELLERRTLSPLGLFTLVRLRRK
ncbi:phosphatidylethanolamine/phosphatidyl-N-methylethanolamine N-methyltransferase [Beijerinckia sp. GAS462]|nr:phosphatidylethanolamine/phosphatidyl-N-methylethanolamine N-methyltransferase [Beijerinckia sp. GAS462]SEB46446.1 phosphatidylethanolamine N-methyltransferase /phosphatidyl-N-methylethanolamine N-methyltransferase [Beijerinckia sp. 28-YEA-48]